MSKTKTIHAYAVQETGSPLEPFSYEVSDLSPNEVEIEVLYCGLCHSDKSRNCPEKRDLSQVAVSCTASSRTRMSWCTEPPYPVLALLGSLDGGCLAVLLVG